MSGNEFNILLESEEVLEFAKIRLGVTQQGSGSWMPFIEGSASGMSKEQFLAYIHEACPTLEVEQVALIAVTRLAECNEILRDALRRCSERLSV